MILIDTCVFMYAAGSDHLLKEQCRSLLRRIALGERSAALDVETLQEILHRYRAAKRWGDARRVYDLARISVPTVLPITVEVVDRARHLMDQHKELTARDALHAAVVLENGLEAICSYDTDFDRVRGLRRVKPQ